MAATKPLLNTLGAVVLLLTLSLLLLGARAMLSNSSQVVVAPLVPLAVDTEAVSDRLAAAVRIATVSADESARSAQSVAAKSQALDQLHALLARVFPNVYRVMTPEIIGSHSLLFTWKGADSALKPLLLMAHQDVVPVAPGTQNDWLVPPFAGQRRDGFIWGRGAWDDKGNLLGQLEALERLISDGFQPRRTIMLASDDDEESGGSGAAAIAARLQSRGIRFEFVLDEGLLLMQDGLPGLTRPVALIGVAEKGYLSLQLRATAVPGHSSMPPPPGSTAIAQLSAALTRLDAAPFPARLEGVARQMLQTLAPEMRLPMRTALSNLWLFGPLIRGQLERDAGADAMLRTTTAITRLDAGNKDNVLPGSAVATVNFRLLPGDTVEAVTARVQQIVGPQIEVSTVGESFNPSPVVPTDSEAYKWISQTVREVFPQALVAPGLMIGATDSRYFEPLSANVFRFSPIRATIADLARFHGTNERIAESNYADLIRFYYRLIVRSAGGA